MNRLALVLSLVGLGCAGAVQSTPDGATDVAMDTADATDSMPAVDAPTADTGPIACGMATCADGQICIQTSGGAGFQYRCVDLPAACNGAVTCGCLTSECTQDAMRTCSVSGRNVSCSCTTCP